MLFFLQAFFCIFYFFVHARFIFQPGWFEELFRIIFSPSTKSEMERIASSRRFIFFGAASKLISVIFL